MAVGKGDHWLDALSYIGGAKSPPPLTATTIRIQQDHFDKIMAVRAKELGVLMDKTVVDAMTQGTGTLTMSADTSPPKPKVGPNAYFVANGVDAMAMLASRLRLPFLQGVDKAYWFNPLGHVSILFDDTKAFITVIAHGKASVLEDDAKNFPTDELVAQFRLLLASQ